MRPFAYSKGGRRQTNANSSQFAQTRHASGRAEVAQLGESGSAAGLEILSTVEGAVLVEMVVDRGVNGCELPRYSHAPEAEHRPLPPSKWLVWILRTSDCPTTGLLPVVYAKLPRALYRGHRPILAPVYDVICNVIDAEFINQLSFDIGAVRMTEDITAETIGKFLLDLGYLRMSEALDQGRPVEKFSCLAPFRSEGAS